MISLLGNRFQTVDFSFRFLCSNSTVSDSNQACDNIYKIMCRLLAIYTSENCCKFNDRNLFVGILCFQHHIPHYKKLYFWTQIVNVSVYVLMVLWQTDAYDGLRYKRVESIRRFVDLCSEGFRSKIYSAIVNKLTTLILVGVKYLCTLLPLGHKYWHPCLTKQMFSQTLYAKQLSCRPTCQFNFLNTVKYSTCSSLVSSRWNTWASTPIDQNT